MPGTALLQREQKVSFHWGFAEVSIGADKKRDHQGDKIWSLTERFSILASTLESHSTANKHLNLRLSTLKATHQQTNISTSVTSQVGKADPVPAQV